ncbi:aminopeptidase [Pullulanibacillus camelliae]|uniref:Aminopeptidase n=1 Tax=Pullulanibacillus camelliae TaxID=1707096 RepID=A0A8J2VKW5_9BACL|nr:aminopeptidase [Pullulanibacillus camelliae]GGE30756.1 aminopeptidase [Pullulanibacillus camelliae]
MSTFSGKLEKYAELAVKNGVNIQKGQELMVSAPISAAPFVRLVAKKAYQAGAKHVHFRWTDDALTRTRYLYAPEEAFEEFPEWQSYTLESLAKKNAAFLTIYIPNPELLKDIDPEKISKDNKVRGQALKAYSEYMMKDKVSWSLVSVPSDEWAAKIFPDLEKVQAIEQLWETIFKMTRADQDDPVAAWDAHKKNLGEKAAYLNNKKYKKLHYKAPGTDLSIEFHEKHKWVDASSVNEKGDAFIANIPTEEVYTLPLRSGVNGTVTSTMPLNYSGTLIEELQLTFKEGRIVDYKAKSGQETLKHLIETDEGSHYLGEVALVPHDSPISQSGLLFYNTLFDENASCHIAIGEAYPTTLEGGAQMTREELDAHGVNDSINHVDFMIGSADLNIDGELSDGTREPVMRNGLWVI